MSGTKNDRDMTGVLYGGVQGFWVRRCSFITTAVGRRRTRPRAIPLALTKISRIDGLPFFLTHGALRARARTRGPL